MAGNPEAGDAWEYVLTNCPWARNKPLWADQTLNLAAVLATGTVRELHATLEYLNLRGSFFFRLENDGVNLRHVNEYEMAAAQAWYWRMEDKLKASRPSRVSTSGTSKILKEVVPRKARHLWRN